MWKENMAGLADMKMYVKRHHLHLQVPKNTKMEVHHSFFQGKSGMRYKTKIYNMI